METTEVHIAPAIDVTQPLDQNDGTLYRRYADVIHGIRATDGDSRNALTDLTAERIKRIQSAAKVTGRKDLEHPVFDFGLALVSGDGSSRLELRSYIAKNSWSMEDRLAEVREKMLLIQAPRTEIIRMGILTVGSNSNEDNTVWSIRESGVITDLRASWEGMEELIKVGFASEEYALTLQI